MIKIFIPQDKTQDKTNIRGLWQSSEGKLYYDYLKIDLLNWDLQDTRYLKRFYLYLDKIQASYKQEAIFYIYKDIGYVYYNRDKIEVLPIKELYSCTKDCLKSFIKGCIKQWQGVTIYKGDYSFYHLVVYHK